MSITESTPEQYNVSMKLIRNIADAKIPNAGYSISSSNILSVVVSESVLSLTPTIELTFTDMGDILENRPIVDGDMVYITMGTAEVEDDFTGIFIISSFYFEMTTYSDSFNVAKLVGYMAPKEAYVGVYKKAYRGSSNSVISTVAATLQSKVIAKASGVESNVWYQNGSAYQFINHIAARSYIPDDGVFVYGDINGDIIYTSYKTQINLPSLYVGVSSKVAVEIPKLMPDEMLFMPYYGYNVINNSVLYNTVSSYGIEYSSYDMVSMGMMLYNPTMSSDRKTDVANVAIDNVAKTTKFSSMEVLNDITYTDTIYTGKVLNDMYRHALFSTTVLVNIAASTPIKLFDGVNIDFPSTTSTDVPNDVYSGEYVATVITYSVSRGGLYKKEVLLGRHGINLSKTKDGALLGAEVV